MKDTELGYTIPISEGGSYQSHVRPKVSELWVGPHGREGGDTGRFGEGQGVCQNDTEGRARRGMFHELWQCIQV